MKEKSMAGSALETQHSEGVLLEEEVREPRRYRVLLHNDDYTSMAFVVEVLMDIFRKSVDEATAIMMAVHEHGVGQCGVYTHEIAESKATRVHRRARDAGFPLKCTLEEVE